MTTFPSQAHRHPDQFLPEVYDDLQLPHTPSLLDIGGGNGALCWHWWASHNARLTVLDCWPYPGKVFPGRFVLGDAADALALFGAKSFDYVQCTELLEHVDREKGFRILEQLPQLARFGVTITTPRGFRPQGEVDGNPYQKHVSAWEPEDFAPLGYSILLNGDMPGTQIVGILATATTSRGAP